MKWTYLNLRFVAGALLVGFAAGAGSEKFVVLEFGELAVVVELVVGLVVVPAALSYPVLSRLSGLGH